MILVVLTHGLLQNAPFVAVMAACPEHVSHGSEGFFQSDVSFCCNSRLDCHPCQY